MTGPEFLLRSIVAGALLGVPAYVVGSVLFSGRHVPPAALATVGAFAGFAAALAVLTAFVPPWFPAILVAVVTAALGAGTFVMIPRAQKVARR